MSVYTPVIRLPSKRKPSLARMNSQSFEPEDFLVSDTLFLATLPKKVRESDIRTLLQHCMPIEIIIDKERDLGQLRFSQPKYADRAYSLYNGFTFTNKAKLQLQMYQDASLDPEATAALLEINGLPDYFDDNKLYDLFRPYGPLNLCKCVMKEGAFRGTAFVQFFHPQSSQNAEVNLNARLLDGYQLSVIPFMHAAQQKEETEDSVVDIMNLYIKNLEPHITNSDLTQLFRKFGRIISARVMTNPQTGQSKGYGFVSFGKTEEAAAALHEMDGVMLGNRPLVVAYHEPRKPRPTTNNTNNTTTTTNYQDSHYHQRQMPPATAINGLGIDNVEELGMNLKDLSIGHKPSMTTINLPPRKDPVMTTTTTTTGNGGGMMKLSSSPMSGTTSTGRSLASLASGMSVSAPPPHPYPQQQQHHHHHAYTPPQPPPVVNLGHNGKPSLRRRGSLESVMTESSATIQRTKLHDAVRTCGDYGKATEDIVDMLLTLKRKERSLCLFNPDFLKDKVNLALEALATCNESESDDEDEDDEDDDDVDGLDMEYTMRKMAAAANMKKPLSPPLSQPVYSTPTTPTNMKRESKAIPIVAPPTPKKSSLPVEQQQQPVKNKDVEALLLSFEGKPVHEKKQLLGDKLFPLVKSTGTRQAPKVTIYLLDTVDLHDLAKIMFDTQLLKMRVEEAFLSLQQ